MANHTLVDSSAVCNAVHSPEFLCALTITDESKSYTMLYLQMPSLYEKYAVDTVKVNFTTQRKLFSTKLCEPFMIV